MSEKEQGLRPIHEAIARIAPPGWVPPTPEQLVELERAERAKIRQEHERAVREYTGEFLARCGVGLLDVRQIVAGDLKDSLPRKYVTDFMRDPTKSILVLSGATGCGKTLAACEAFLTLKKPCLLDINEESWKWAKPGRFARAAEVVCLNRAHWKDRERLESLESSPLLVIDDVGHSVQQSAAWLDSIINARYQSDAKVILTTNMNRRDFETFYGPRVVSRIQHRGMFGSCGVDSFRVGRTP